MPAAQSIQWRQEAQRASRGESRKQIEARIPRRACYRTNRPKSCGTEAGQQTKERPHWFTSPNHPNREKGESNGDYKNDECETGRHPLGCRLIEYARQIGGFAIAASACPFIQRVEVQ